MQNRYNYKSRFDMVKRGFTEGDDEAEKLGLGEDWRNWSPLHNHLFQLGVFSGVFACVVGYLMHLAFWWLILRQ